MYYRYSVHTKDKLHAQTFRSKQQAIEKAQSIALKQHRRATVYRERVYPNSGMVDLIPIVRHWWDGSLQWQKEDQ